MQRRAQRKLRHSPCGSLRLGSSALVELQLAVRNKVRELAEHVGIDLFCVGKDVLLRFGEVLLYEALLVDNPSA